MGNKVIKLAQYADDTTLFLKDNDDVICALGILDDFEVFSGLRLNKNKTEAMRLGRPNTNDTEVGNIRWKDGKDTIKILGVYFSNNICASNLEYNWNERIEKIIRLIKCWEKRNLSIIGKIQIIKTFLLSHLVLCDASHGTT